MEKNYQKNYNNLVTITKLSHCLKINKVGKKVTVVGNYGIMALLRGNIFCNEPNTKNIPAIAYIKHNNWKMEYSL